MYVEGCAAESCVDVVGRLLLVTSTSLIGVTWALPRVVAGVFGIVSQQPLRGWRIGLFQMALASAVNTLL